MNDEKRLPPTFPTADRSGVDRRLPLPTTTGPHPATLEEERLLDQCRLRTQPRSGPGGQHRNRTSSGVFLQHLPTGVVAEATERRRQADNRSVAVARLRLKLATEVRTRSQLDGPLPTGEADLQEAYGRSGLRIGQRNRAHAAVLALLLNDLHAAGGRPSLVAELWQTTTSAVIRFIKTHPPAFALVNQIRRHHHQRPLK